MIFDENMIFGPRARVWYPVLRELVRIKEPELFSILPVDPLFRSDDEFKPLQAADLFAWCAREQAEGNDACFLWLIDEMPNVRSTEHSQYYDKERMHSLRRMSHDLARRGDVPEEFLVLYKETYRKIYGRLP
jgi:hypothetical protein